MEFPEHLAHYNRYLWKEPGLIVVTGRAEKLWRGREAYAARYEIAPEADAGAALLGRLLAAAGLAAVSLPEREHWGWSVSLPGMAAGLFCAADPEGMMCGRVLESAAKDSGLCVVQRQGGKSPLAQSHVTLMTQDPVEAVERYFEEAEQTLIRIAVGGDGRGVLLRPLPGGVFDDISGLSDAELVGRVFGHAEAGRLQLLEEVLLFYDCPCSSGKIAAVLRGLPADEAARLWGDAELLETACPRCGRRYAITRREMKGHES